MITSSGPQEQTNICPSLDNLPRKKAGRGGNGTEPFLPRLLPGPGSHFSASWPMTKSEYLCSLWPQLFLCNQFHRLKRPAFASPVPPRHPRTLLPLFKSNKPLPHLPVMHMPAVTSSKHAMGHPEMFTVSIRDGPESWNKFCSSTRLGT